jgi:DNA-binding transcriptional ArsR family regulator
MSIGIHFPMARTNCKIKHLTQEETNSLRKELFTNDTLHDLAETFKVLGDPTRLKIIQLLSKQELCVCALASILHVTDSVISHQLRTLRNLRLVKFRKEGQMTYYSLDDAHITHLFNEGLAHVKEEQ